MHDQIEILKRHFASIGGRLQFAGQTRRSASDYELDVVVDRRDEEVYSIALGTASDRIEFSVVSVDRKRRHLLMIVKQPDAKGGTVKHRYLCGHDERSWFVAAVPDSRRNVTTVARAMEALKPEEVIQAQTSSRVRRKRLNKRKNRGFVRQGEWFFIPSPDLRVDQKFVLSREPLRRGGGKPHLAEQVFRRGGTTVYVSRQHPGGVDEKTYRQLLKQDPRLAGAAWRVMRKNPEVYCRGRVSHPDHASVVLRGWHRVLPNTESDAPWMQEMVFLD